LLGELQATDLDIEITGFDNEEIGRFKIDEAKLELMKEKLLQRQLRGKRKLILLTVDAVGIGK
jgi:hypothetical protein